MLNNLLRRVFWVIRGGILKTQHINMFEILSPSIPTDCEEASQLDNIGDFYKQTECWRKFIARREWRHDDKFCQPKTMSKKTDSLQLGRPRQITTKSPSSANNTKEDKVQDPPWMVSFSVVNCESLSIIIIGKFAHPVGFELKNSHSASLKRGAIQWGVWSFLWLSCLYFFCGTLK